MRRSRTHSPSLKPNWEFGGESGRNNCCGSPRIVTPLSLYQCARMRFGQTRRQNTQHHASSKKRTIDSARNHAGRPTSSTNTQVLFNHSMIECSTCLNCIDTARTEQVCDRSWCYKSGLRSRSKSNTCCWSILRSGLYGFAPGICDGISTDRGEMDGAMKYRSKSYSEQRIRDSVLRASVPLPTGCVSPNNANGASAFIRPRRIFSSLGKGGKKSGGGGWPGSVMSGMLGGADVKAERLWAYASSSG